VEFRVLTSQVGPMRIAASSKEEAEAIARKDGHQVIATKEELLGFTSYRKEDLEHYSALALLAADVSSTSYLKSRNLLDKLPPGTKFKLTIEVLLDE